jgi:hemolysin activation/secretion protein
MLVLATLPSARAAGEPAPAKPFEVDEYVVDGNSVLSEREIETAVYPYLGPDKTDADIEKARATLEAAYRDRGFQTVAVAPAEGGPVDGTVHLQVVEERVGRLRAVGAVYHSPNDIKAAAPSLQEGTVPNFNQVESDIGALNQWPDRTVTPILKPGKEPDTVDVDLKVEDSNPLHASVELNNRQSDGTTPLRLNASISYDNLWQLGHTIGLTFVTAPENISDAKSFIGNYIARIPDTALSLQLTGIVSSSNVLAVSSTDVVGDGDMVELRLISPLPGTKDLLQSVYAEVDYKHFKDLTIVAGLSSLTPVTYYPFTAGYTGTLTEDSATDQADFSITFAAPELGSPTNEFDNKRYLARGQTFYVKGNLDRVQQLPDGFSADVHFGGQITDQPLISNEQFAVGGQDTVRGYLEAEALGDYGYLGGLQVTSPSLASLIDLPDSDTVKLLAFIEGGVEHLRSPLLEQKSVFSLASTGIGLRTHLFDHVNGSLDLAIPLVSTQYTDAFSEHLLFRVWTEL